MAKNPQTFEKRLRERKKQLKRLAKFTARNERNAKKREDGSSGMTEADAQTAADYGIPYQPSPPPPTPPKSPAPEKP